MAVILSKCEREGEDAKIRQLLAERPTHINFDLNAHPINARSGLKVAPTHKVAEGEGSWADIAERWLHNRTLAARLAEFNHCDISMEPPVGKVLIAPPGFLTLGQNKAGMFVNYTRLDFLGDVSPEIANVHRHQHHRQWWKLVVEVAVGAALMSMGIPAGLLGIQNAVIASLIDGMIESLATQLTAIALNDQHGVDMRNVLVNGVTHMLTGGLNLGPTQGDGVLESALHGAEEAMVSDAIQQSLNKMMGGQDAFHARELWASGLAGGVKGGVNEVLGLNPGDQSLDFGQAIEKTFVDGAIDFGANKALHVDVDARDALARAVGNAIGTATGRAVGEHLWGDKLHQQQSEASKQHQGRKNPITRALRRAGLVLSLGTRNRDAVAAADDVGHDTVFGAENDDVYGQGADEAEMFNQRLSRRDRELLQAANANHHQARDDVMPAEEASAEAGQDSLWQSVAEGLEWGQQVLSEYGHSHAEEIAEYRAKLSQVADVAKGLYMLHHMVMSVGSSMAGLGSEINKSFATAGTRVVGGLEAAGGVALVDVGAGLSATGIGAVLGAPLIALGMDEILTGSREMLTGRESKTLSEHAMMSLGASEELASGVRTSVDLAAGGVGLYKGFKYLKGVGLFSKGAKTAEVASATEHVANEAEAVASATSASPGPKILIKDGKPLFKPGEAERHFNKHAEQIKKKLGLKAYSKEQYLNDAQWVINNGRYTEEMNGYVYIVGGKGKAKAMFVGLDGATGNITTFSFKSIKDIEKKAPSLGIVSQRMSKTTDTIGSDINLGYKPPYRMR